MGQIRIDVEGSFEPNVRRVISAQEHGHARAVADAIKFLTDEVLPRAIAQDHKLHAQGHYPARGFGVEPKGV